MSLANASTMVDEGLLGGGLAEASLDMWLAYIESKKHGKRLQVGELDSGHEALVLDDNAAQGFVIGRNSAGTLFLGVVPWVGGWFVELPWKLALIKSGYLRLNMTRGGEPFEICLPLRPAIAERIPQDQDQILLAQLVPDNAPGEDILFHMGMTKELPCHHIVPNRT